MLRDAPLSWLGKRALVAVKAKFICPGQDKDEMSASGTEWTS